MKFANNTLILFFREYGLLISAASMLVIECGFRAAYWQQHFASIGEWLSWSVSSVFSVAIALTCIALLLLTAKEFAENATTQAWSGLFISVSLRGYILWENVAVSDGNAHTQVFLQVISGIVAIAEVRYALTAYADFQQQAAAKVEVQPEAIPTVTEPTPPRRRNTGSKPKAEVSATPNESAGPEALAKFEAEYILTNSRKPTRKEAAAHFQVTDRTIRTWAAQAA